MFGQALERSGDVEGAWEALERANQAMSKVQQYSVETELHTLHTVMSVFQGGRAGERRAARSERCQSGCISV